VAAPGAEQEITLPQTINDVTPSGHDARALSVAVAIRTKSWVIGIRSPDTPPLPEGIRWEIDSLRAPRAVVTDPRAAIESAKAERVAPATRPDGTPSAEATLVQLVGIGANDATLLGAEGVDRDVRNRRERASGARRVAAGGPRGPVVHDPGIRTAGTPRVRTQRTPMAGRWIRSPPDSPIPQGVHAACAAQHGRARTRALVAVARTRVIAPSLDRGPAGGLRPAHPLPRPPVGTVAATGGLWERCGLGEAALGRHRTTEGSPPPGPAHPGPGDSGHGTGRNAGTRTGYGVSAPLNALSRDGPPGPTRHVHQDGDTQWIDSRLDRRGSIRGLAIVSSCSRGMA